MTTEYADIDRVTAMEQYSRATRHQNHILRELAGERDRQDHKWGVQRHADGTGAREYYMTLPFEHWRDRAIEFCDEETTWVRILLEEAFEAAAESDPVALREELIQVAAVAVAWIEAIDARH